MKKIITMLSLCMMGLFFSTASQACFLFCGAKNYAETKYPLVLVHGGFSADSFFGVDVFYGIPRDLRSQGATVFTPQVSALNSTDVRGEQLLEQVEEIINITGAEKVNLLGYSHGSHTVRYVAAMRPDLVASVASLHGAVKGTPLADLGQSLREIPVISDLLEPVVFSIVNIIGDLITLFSGNEGYPQDAEPGFFEITSVGAAEFNARFPQAVPETECGEGDYEVNGVRYFSWSGASPITNIFDPLDWLASITTLAFFGEPNDSIIGSCSSHLGQVIRDDYRMNHYDGLNQSGGLVSIFEVNPKTLYRNHANRLKKLGL